MSAPESAASALFPGKRLQLEAIPDTGGAVQKVIHETGTTYLLKCFDADNAELIEREIGMRQVLREIPSIAFPEVIDQLELDGDRYLLMEFIDGERLDSCWQRDPSRIPEEMAQLGTLLGQIHAIPLASAEPFLAPDTSIYTDEHCAGMRAALDQYLSTAEKKALSSCFELVDPAVPEQTMLHGDFTPLQVIVRPDGRWVLFDFEFGMVGPFADDLAGAEVRTERLGFTETAPFLAAYQAVNSRQAAYEPLRIPFKTHLLATILTAAINRDGESPSIQDLEQLRKLLGSLS